MECLSHCSAHNSQHLALSLVMSSGLRLSILSNISVMISADSPQHLYRVEFASVYLQKPVPVKVLVTHIPAADEVCPSEDLCPTEEEDLQQSNGLPIITTIESATSSEEIKPYFRGRLSLIILAMVLTLFSLFFTRTQWSVVLQW